MSVSTHPRPATLRDYAQTYGLDPIETALVLWDGPYDAEGLGFDDPLSDAHLAALAKGDAIAEGDDS